VFAAIDEDESIEYTLKVAHRRAEGARYEAECQALVNKINGQKDMIAFVADDYGVDSKLKDAGELRC